MFLPKVKELFGQTRQSFLPSGFVLIDRPAVSVQSSFGNLNISISVCPLLAARLIMAAARASRSSSDTPDGLENFSINAFFSASAAESSLVAAEAFSASRRAISIMTSLALGTPAKGVGRLGFHFFSHGTTPRNPSSLTLLRLAEFDLSQER